MPSLLTHHASHGHAIDDHDINKPPFHVTRAFFV